VDILLVEDVWHVAKALQNLLRVLGANVVGPASTIAEAERLISEQLPHVALVDFNLRGELATSLIDRLNDRGIPVVVTTGYADVPLSPTKVAAILRKPIRAVQLFAALSPVIGQEANSNRSTS
jgi:DNA-binding NtrC family response regulator